MKLIYRNGINPIHWRRMFFNEKYREGDLVVNGLYVYIVDHHERPKLVRDREVYRRRRKNEV